MRHLPRWNGVTAAGSKAGAQRSTDEEAPDLSRNHQERHHRTMHDHRHTVTTLERPHCTASAVPREVMHELTAKGGAIRSPYGHSRTHIEARRHAECRKHAANRRKHGCDTTNAISMRHGALENERPGDSKPAAPHARLQIIQNGEFENIPIIPRR